jgi:hypothetical protein
MIAAVCIAFLGLFGISFAWWYLSLGGDFAYAALFTALIGVACSFLLLVVVYIQRDFLTEVSFLPREFSGRTRAGEIRVVPYSRLLQIIAWPRWARLPRRYHILYQSDRWRWPEGFWLTPETKTRLEEAARRASADRAPRSVPERGALFK